MPRVLVTTPSDKGVANAIADILIVKRTTTAALAGRRSSSEASGNGASPTVVHLTVAERVAHGKVALAEVARSATAATSRAAAP